MPSSVQAGQEEGSLIQFRAQPLKKGGSALLLWLLSVFNIKTKGFKSLSQSLVVQPLVVANLQQTLQQIDRRQQTAQEQSVAHYRGAASLVVGLRGKGVTDQGERLGIIPWPQEVGQVAHGCLSQPQRFQTSWVAK